MAIKMIYFTCKKKVLFKKRPIHVFYREKCYIHYIVILHGTHV